MNVAKEKRMDPIGDEGSKEGQGHTVDKSQYNLANTIEIKTI